MKAYDRHTVTARNNKNHKKPEETVLMKAAGSPACQRIGVLLVRDKPEDFMKFSG
jgi:hypothetical protein